MPTIAQIVEDIIARKPFLQEGLSRGIVNNAALAEELIPQIEKVLNKKVKFSAVNMAIRRLSEKLERSFVSEAKFCRDSNITMKSGLFEITVYKNADTQKTIRKLYSIVDFRKGDFLTITQGLYETMVITDIKYLDRILSMFSRKSVRKIIKGLGSLTISIPEDSIETVGLFYIVTRALNWEDISIVDIVSTLTEMTYVLREDDLARAFNVLKELVESNR